MVTQSDPIRPIRFVGEEPLTKNRSNYKPRISRISARGRQPIAIDVINSDLKEGYLPKIDTINGVYIGEAVVSVNDQGRCHVLAINTLTKNVDIEISPRELIPFEHYSLPEEKKI